MPRQKIKESVFYEDGSQQSQNVQMGTSMGRKDYITLKKNKVKPLAANQQNEHTVQLFRNEELNKYLVDLETEEKNQNKKIKNRHANDPKIQVFEQVFFNLRNGWNVCLTGGMDKMQIMADIVDYLQKMDQNVFIINGYAQPLNEKKIYNSFGTHLIKSGFAETVDCVLTKEQLEEYEQVLTSTPQDTVVYVVFYQLSNYGFLNSQMQHKLAQLLKLPRLRVIASIQNCKIVLNWSFSNLFLYSGTIQMLNFVFVSANSTCFPITSLLKFLPLSNQKSQKTELQISQIWKSLNRNQRQIAIILAENELNNINSLISDQNYLTFQQLLDACIDKIILSDDHQLRQNLIELTDHRVVIEQVDKNKNKRVFIMKLDRRILESMIQGKYDKYDDYNEKR